MAERDHHHTSMRQRFMERLDELWRRAGNPKATSVAAAIVRRANQARPPSAQRRADQELAERKRWERRVSAWRRGTNVPADVDELNQMLVVLVARLSGADRHGDLADPSRWALLRRRAYDEPPDAPSAPATGLPGVPGDFVGRHAALAELGERFREHDPAGVVVGIHAIDGMAGVGKTTLALYAAHQNASRYPDGAFFVDLHGYTPGIEPLPAETALDQLLRDAGLPTEAIPAEAAARQARWRAVMANRRALILLDNARDSDQVRPLLPMAAGCLVLVTSRRRLTALPEARPLALDVLALPEAADLFTQVVGDARGADRVAVETVVRLVGRLPLAVRLAAGRLRHEAGSTVAGLAADLACEHGRLDYLSPEEAGLKAAFAVSMQRLSTERRRAFWAVGLHPGPHIGVRAVAALAGVPETRARELLRVLAEHHLVEPDAYVETPRWRLHDLVRDFARNQAAQQLTADEQITARRRLANHYVESVQTDSRGWLAAERDNLLGFAQQLVDTGAASSLLDAATGLRLLGYWGHARGIYQAVHDAYATADDRPGQARALRGLAEIARLTGDYRTARTQYQASYGICADLGDRSGQASARWGLADVARVTSNYGAARKHYQASYEICVELDDRPGQASVRWGLADVARITGDHATAAAEYQASYDICVDLGDLPGQATALRGLADAARVAADYSTARTRYQASYDICIDLGDRRGQANAGWGLADVARLTGDHATAGAQYQASYDICLDLGDRRGQANALRGLADVAQLVGDHVTARDHFEKAYDLCAHLGDRRGEAAALRGLADVARVTGDYPAARAGYEKAHSIRAELEDRLGQAEALRGLADVARRSGDYLAARTHYLTACGISQALGDQPGRTVALQGIMEVVALARGPQPGTGQ